MNEEEKRKLIDMITDGINVTEYGFSSLNILSQDILEFIHDQETEFFCWKNEDKIYFSKDLYTGEIYLQLDLNHFEFKLNQEYSPYNIKACARFILLILLYLQSKNKVKPLNKNTSKYKEIHISKIKNIKNFYKK